MDFSAGPTVPPITLPTLIISPLAFYSLHETGHHWINLNPHKHLPKSQVIDMDPSPS